MPGHAAGELAGELVRLLRSRSGCRLMTRRAFRMALRHLLLMSRRVFRRTRCGRSLALLHLVSRGVRGGPRRRRAGLRKRRGRQQHG